MNFRINVVTVLLATILLSGCGSRDPINVMTVYDASTMDC